MRNDVRKTNIDKRVVGSALLHFAFPARLIVAGAVGLGAVGACRGNEPAAGPDVGQPSTKAESVSEARGVPLGDYRIRSYYPVDAQKSTIRFTLYAAVKSDRFTEVQRLVEEHHQRLRDQVITATRLSPLAVFQEPELTSFRRRVLVRLHRAIPELVIDDLYISDFDLTIKSL